MAIRNAGMQKPTLVYLRARGRAELIRLVCAEAGVEFAFHPVGFGTPPVDGRPTDFPALKASGTLPFEQVPVWEEPGGFTVAQSGAIANYLARTHGLRGKSAAEEAKIDEVLGGVDDLREELRRLARAAPAERAAVRAELLEKTAPRWLGYFERILRKNQGGVTFVAGDALSVADLSLWYVLEMLRDNGFGAALAETPALAAFAERIAARPRLAAYLGSALRPALQPLPT